MKKMIVLLMVVLMTAVTFAKGPAAQITISGPELGEAIIITDEDLLFPISLGTLENFVVGVIPEPENLDAGYKLERYYETNGLLWQFDEVVYYPTADGGYVFYVGLTNGWSPYDGKWFQANPTGAAVMREILQPYLPAEIVSKSENHLFSLTDFLAWLLRE